MAENPLTERGKPNSARAAPLLVGVLDAARFTAGMAATGQSDMLLIELGTVRAEHAMRSRALIAAAYGDLRARQPLLVGLHGLLDDAEMSLDIAAAISCGARAVVLKNCAHGAEVQHLDVLLTVAEAEAGVEIGRTGILAMSGDNAGGLLRGSDFSGKSDRLLALGWQGARLDQHLGGKTGRLRETARGLTRLAAAAADVIAVDWIEPQLSGDALRQALASASDNGFGWVLIEEPEQIRALQAG